MTGTKAARRRHRRAKKEAWREAGHARVVETFRRWGIEQRLPPELVHALAATRRQPLFDREARRPEVAPVIAAIEKRLGEPVSGGGLSPRDFFELVLPGIARLPKGLPGIPRTPVIGEIIDRFDATLEEYVKELHGRSWSAAFERSRIDRAVYLVHMEGRFHVERRTFEHRPFEVDGISRRVWHLTDWPEGPVLVQAHAFDRAEERLPYDAGIVHFAIVASLSRPIIVGRQGDSLQVELRVGGMKHGYLLVTELAGEPGGKPRHLVRTFETLGMRGTPEGQRLRKKMSEDEIRRLGLDTIEAFASDAVQARRRQLEKLGFGPNFEIAEELRRRPA